VSIQEKTAKEKFFKPDAHDGWARSGSYELEGKRVATPAYFPVVALFCGQNPQTLFAGGIYRHIKSHIKAHPDNFDCLMTSAVQFLDFHFDQAGFERALSRSVQDWFGFDGMLFVDSGGFKLISGRYERHKTLSGYGSLKIKMTAQNVLRIQHRMGASIVATLDFPLAGKISAEEKSERIKASIENSHVALSCRPGGAKVLAAVHGHTPQEIRSFVSALDDGFDGYAVGSLVPLRNNYESLIRIVNAAKCAVPNGKPIHLFGVTGKLLPLFAYMGIDSFDSATYVLAGRYGRYLMPETRKAKDISKISRRICECPICREHRLFEMKLMDSRSGALIALHNYYVFKNETFELQQSIQKGELDKFLGKYCETDPRLAEAFKLVKRLCSSRSHAR
jgi:tRNA-guanine family transglycosylase